MKLELTMEEAEELFKAREFVNRKSDSDRKEKPLTYREAFDEIDRVLKSCIEGLSASYLDVLYKCGYKGEIVLTIGRFGTTAENVGDVLPSIKTSDLTTKGAYDKLLRINESKAPDEPFIR